MKKYLNITKNAIVLFIVLGMFSCEKIVPAGVNFTEVTASGYESDGAQTVQIDFTRAVESEITIEVAFTGTADYYAGSTLITVPAGEITANVNFELIDNGTYEPGVTKTVIIDLIGITGPGVDDAGFGTYTTYTYNVDEDDMKIDLEWTASEGLSSDHDLDLYLHNNIVETQSSTSGSNNPETVILRGSATDQTYYTVSHYFGSIFSSTVQVNYTITLNFPDGSTQSHSDTFTSLDQSDRTLWSISKSGVNYTAMQDPFGVNGRVEGTLIIKDSK